MRRLDLLVVVSALLVLVSASASAFDADRPGTYRVNRTAILYESPSAESRILRRIPAGTLVEVVRVLDQWYEIHSTRGNPNGFIRRSYADPVDGSRRLRRTFRPGLFTLLDPVVVREAPDMDARRIGTLAAGTRVRVVGRRGNWYRIESERGRPPGYIPVISARRLRDLEPNTD